MKFKFGKGNSISNVTINGQSFTGKNVVVSNNKIMIDGKEAEINYEEKTFNIVVTGDVESVVNESGLINVTGNAGEIKSTSGDIEIGGEVKGDVKTTSGDVASKGDIVGDVGTVSGDVDAKSIKGKVNTISGDIST